MRTFATYRTGSLLTRSVDNGSAFVVNIFASDLAAGNSLIYEFTTHDNPIVLASRVLKSDGSKIDYHVYVGAMITGGTPVPVTAAWLNQQMAKPEDPNMSVNFLSGADISGGVEVAADLPAGPPFVALRVLSTNTTFHVHFNNTGASSSNSALELVFVQLGAGTYDN